MYLLIICVIPLLLGVFFFSVGAKVILTRRPFIVPGKILRMIVLVAISPILLKPLINANAGSIFPALMWLLIVAVIWRQSSGYSIFGICNPEFRQSLIATLNSLKISFQEDMTGITIPSENILLETTSMSSGLSRIRIRDKSHAQWLQKFATALKEHYEATPEKVTLGFSVFYLIFGILMMIFMVVLMMPKA